MLWLPCFLRTFFKSSSVKHVACCSKYEVKLQTHIYAKYSCKIAVKKNLMSHLYDVFMGQYYLWYIMRNLFQRFLITGMIFFSRISIPLRTISVDIVDPEFDRYVVRGVCAKSSLLNNDDVF